MIKLIALYSPAAQSGKSTVASYLNNRGYRTIKFASILKDMIRTMLHGAGIPMEIVERMVEGDLKEQPIRFSNELSVTPRALMQTLGTEWGRSINPDLWADLTLAKAKASRSPVVIDDLRFPNEFDAVRNAGGIVGAIVRPGVIRPEHCHPSEGQLDNHKFDFVIYNDSTVEELICKVSSLLSV